MNQARTNILLIFTLVFFKFCAYSQTDSLITKILNADKVEILSHQDLHLGATYEEMKIGISGHWRKIVDSSGNLNDCIVVEKVMLTKGGIDSLIDILSKKYYSEVPVDKASCFLPHETIIMYSKERYSFLDICFDCRRFSSSGDIIFSPEFLSTDEQWDELRNFFIANGIKYKIALKNQNK